MKWILAVLQSLPIRLRLRLSFLVVITFDAKKQKSRSSWR